VIFRFEYRRYRLPFRAAVRTGHGVWAEREGLIVRLENDAGAVAYGEAAPIPWFGTETVDEAESAARAFGKQVVDSQFDELPIRLRCLRFALATARASNRGEPERKHLGVAALLPAGRAARREIASKAESGFRVFKWKVGVGDAADELVLLDDLCAALPEGAKVRLDANGAWDRRSAERWLERSADRPVEFIEQPISPQSRGADDTLRGLAADYPTPIALDESIASDEDVERCLGAGWRGVFVVKPALLGDARATLARLRTANADVVFSSALETALGAQAALRLAFEWTGSSRALGFGVWPLFRDSRFDGPAAAPFVRWEDVERIDPETLWNALD
jgi:O-succinylbenzoate synthase